MSRLDELFEAALEIEPADRAAWLDAACDGDDGLRRELQRLLRADAHAGGILESGRPLICEALAEEAEAPEHFGVWRVLGALGTGGMGAVWLAERDGGDFVQRAAIKQVAWPTPGLLQRFRTERQILSRLEHPGIARLIDGGVDDNGCPYLAMEYVEGTRIDAWVRNHQLDVRATVRLVLQVCDAVQFAHRSLVVHSDIKPSNILVVEGGKPRLLDFGIARVLSDESTDATRTATRLLTPDYAAPEWLAGGPVTTAVDIYALGVLAYELLSGSKPYRIARDGTRPATQAPDALTRPPSMVLVEDAIDRRARQRALRGDLDRVVLTAMAREPGRRYATVEAFAAELRNWLDGRAVVARGDHAWYRLRKFVARNRVAVATAALAALALLAATGFSLYQARVAQHQAQRADAVRLFLADTFAQVDPTAHPDTPVSMRELLDHSEQRLAAARDIPLPVRVDLETLIGTFYWNLADTVASKRLLEDAVDRAARGGVADPLHARALFALAEVENDRGEVASAYRHASSARTLALRDGSIPDVADRAQRMVIGLSIAHDGAVKAEPGIRSQLQRDRARHGDVSEAVVMDLVLLGQALDGQSRYRESQAALAEAVANARQVAGLYKSKLGLALILLGITEVHRGRYAEATRAFSECSTIAARLWGTGNVRASIVRASMLGATLGEGRFRQSLPVALRLRDEAQRMKQSRPDHYAVTLGLLGDAQLGLGHLGEAEAAYRMALAQWSVATNGRDTRSTAHALSSLAMSLKLQGRLGEAEDAYRHAIAIGRKVSPATSHWLAADYAGLGDVLRWRGQVDEASRQAGIGVAMLRANGGEESPLAMRVLAWHTEALLDHGDARGAQPQASAALAMARRVLPPGNWQLAGTLYAAARAELATGHAAEAESNTRGALDLRRAHLPGDDPRVLEVQVALIRALEMQGEEKEAASLRVKVEPLLAKSDSPYLVELRRRLVAE